MKEMMTIATFNERDKAEILGERLNAAGVPTEIYNEAQTQHSVFMLKQPLASFRLKVDKNDFERSKKLIAEWDGADGALRDAVRCPDCKGSRIEYPQFTRNFITPAVAAILARVGVFEAQFFCEDCNFTWVPHQPEKLDLDRLNWPKSDKML